LKVTGYTSLEEFQDYINLTDICFNLRYPYNGETSASLVRNLAAGNVVITNNIGSFGEIPDGVCIKLPNVEELTEEEEIDHIYCAVKKCLESPDWCKQLKTAAKDFAITTLNINQTIREYIACIENTSYNSIDEKLLYSLSEKLHMKKANTKELKHLSNTLAWLKEIHLQENLSYQ